MKISRISILAIALGTVAMFVQDASAQGGRGRGGGLGGRSLLTMVENDKVQKELELEEGQIEKIQEFAGEQREKMREEFQNLRSPGGDREEMMSAMTKMREEMAKEETKTMKEVLNEKQLKRYSQLNVQLMGIRALNNSEIAKQVGLTEEEIKNVSDAFASNREKQTEIFQELRDSGARDGMREKMQEMRTELEESVMKMLSDDQKEKLEEIKGEKFEFPERQRRGGRNRPQDF